MSTDSISADAPIVLRRETYLVVTLRVTGAPRVRIKNPVRETTIAPEIVEFFVRDGLITDVTAIGPTFRKDGKWGAQRTALWSWQAERERIPAWLAELARAEFGGAE